MDSYERRAHFAHRFGTPRTTLNAGLELLERYLADHLNDPRLLEIVEMLWRASHRIDDAAELLNRNIVDASQCVTIVITDDELASTDHVTTLGNVHEHEKLVYASEQPHTATPNVRKVLLVEDSAVYRALMSAHLKQHGYEVLTAPDGIRGMDVARQERPDLIILDLMLPHLSGEELALIFSEDPETKQIPLMIYTALEEADRVNLDPRFHVVRKDQALENLNALIEELLTERSHLNAPSILIIEDDDSVQQVLTLGLREAGYAVTLATTAEDGLRLTQFQNFDLIILDLLLPGIDGWDALTMLRERVQTATTPIMLLSSLDHPREKVRGLQLGADDYVTKPFDWNELLARISASLRRREIEASANPSTMLPGNKSIERAITARIEAGIPFAVAYCDLDNFKAYNDTYGFLKGDAIIHQTARIITKTVERLGVAGDFVGHIGGDDFVLITEPSTVEVISKTIIEEFDRLVPLFYDEEARRRGTIEQYDREGNFKIFPLASISIGVISSLNHVITHYAQVGDIAADVKKRAKSYRGSAYFIEEGTKQQ